MSKNLKPPKDDSITACSDIYQCPVCGVVFQEIGERKDRDIKGHKQKYFLIGNKEYETLDPEFSIANTISKKCGMLSCQDLAPHLPCFRRERDLKSCQGAGCYLKNECKAYQKYKRSKNGNSNR